MAAESPKKQTQFKPNQSQTPKSPNEYKLSYNKGLKKKRGFRSPKKRTQYEPNTNPIKANSPSAIRNTQYEIRDTNPNKPKQTQFQMQKNVFGGPKKVDNY